MTVQWYEPRSVVEHGRLVEKPVMMSGEIGDIRKYVALCPDCFKAVERHKQLTNVRENIAEWTMVSPMHRCEP